MIPTAQEQLLLYNCMQTIIVIAFYLIPLLFYNYIVTMIGSKSKLLNFFQIANILFFTVSTGFWIICSSVYPRLNGIPEIIMYLGQVPGWMMILNTFIIILTFKHSLGPKTVKYLFIYLLIPCMGIVLYNLHLSVTSPFISISITLLLLHLFMHQRQSKQLQEQALQLEQTRNHIVLSQIKPHFIYNSLNTIYYLCEKDPSLAQKAIIEFSDYLRGNLDSFGSDKPIPFQLELEHIHHYLYLEQLRFSEDLNVVYKIEETEFDVPPLSVQLAVENAVKHGISRKLDGGTVTIESYRNTMFNIVTVSDDGVGFDISSLENNSGNKSHVGLQNMIFRIETISHGSVDIKSAPGEGTKITFRIPR